MFATWTALTVTAAFCCQSVVYIQAVPLPQELNTKQQNNVNSHVQDFAEEGEFFEGDIILRPEQLSYIQAKKAQQFKRTLISDPTAIWPHKTVYYEFAPREFSEEQRTRIQQALGDIMSVSCVRFVPRTTQPAYIVLRNSALVCAAAVGYHILGPLDVYLGGPTCQTRGTIQHELLHTLGFWHEHTRPDRDLHIEILWRNIFPGKEFNFNKRDPSEIMTLNMPYDYGSVMHYRSIAFSKDLWSQTIVPKVPSAAQTMGQRIRFSQVDLAKLNRLYQCPASANYYLGDDIAGKAAIIGDVEEEINSEIEEDEDNHEKTHEEESMDESVKLKPEKKNYDSKSKEKENGLSEQKVDNNISSTSTINEIKASMKNEADVNKFTKKVVYSSEKQHKGSESVLEKE